MGRWPKQGPSLEVEKANNGFICVYDGQTNVFETFVEVLMFACVLVGEKEGLPIIEKIREAFKGVKVKEEA